MFSAGPPVQSLIKSAQPDYPKEAVEKRLRNLIRIRPEGVRKAKEIVDVYLKTGNDESYKLLKEITG